MSDLTQIHTAQMDTPSDNGMNFNTLLANYTPATHDQLEPHEHLLNLAQMLGSDKLLYIDENISIDGEFKPTADSIGVVLHRPDHRANNLAMFPLLDGQAGKPFLLTSFNNEVFIIGDGSEVIAVPDLATATNIYVGLDDGMTGYSLIVPPESHQFNSMVKAFAKQSQVTIPCDMLQRERYKRDFKTDNVQLVATIDPIEKLLLTTDMAGVLADGETIIDVLGGFVWGTPEPLADDGNHDTPYPLQAWQGVLGDMVKAIAYHAQIPPAMAGQCVLGALSTIGQRFINAPMGHEYKPVNLFLITEGGTGSGKTRGTKLSHRNIEQWNEKAYNTFIELLNEWQLDLDGLKGKERNEYIKSNPKPVNQSTLIQDGTIEAVLDQFILDGKPNLSWTSDDAGQFFNGHSMKSDTAGNAVASLAKLWDGSPVNRTRSTRGNNPQYKTNAYNVRLTLDLQGQRIILEPALSDPLLLQQGFLARALLACPETLQGKRVWNTPEYMDNNPDDDPRLQAFWGRCNILLDPLPTEIQTDPTGKEIRFDMPFENRQARQALADFQQRVENRQAKGAIYEFYKGFASRMAENATRIAALMAFFDCQKVVSVEYLERAFLLVEYSTTERLRYLDIKTEEKSDSQKLIDWLIAKAKIKNTIKLNWSYVFSGCPKPMRKNSKFLKEVVEILESGNYVRMEKEGKATFIYINLKLLG